jgi:hypothetical protein
MNEKRPDPYLVWRKNLERITGLTATPLREFPPEAFARRIIAQHPELSYDRRKWYVNGQPDETEWVRTLIHEIRGMRGMTSWIDRVERAMRKLAKKEKSNDE